MGVDDLQDNGLIVATPREHVIFTDLDGVEGVLVDLNSKKYYQLNETATFVWRGLEQRMTVSSIAKEMSEFYDVSPDRALSSVEKMLRSLCAQELILLR